MSENKITEQIHLTQAEIKRFWFARGWRNLQVKRHSSENYTSYILKSKYDELLKEKEELEKENEWISVEDRLPEFDSCVFFYYLVWQIIDGKKIPNKIPLIGWYKRVPSGGGCFLTREDREDWFIKEEGITHWKPLPKAPIIKPTEK